MKNPITKEKFLAYEKVRVSGKTNMFDTIMVIRLSGYVLDQSDCSYIMRDYATLAKKFLPKRFEEIKAKNPHAVALGSIKSQKKSRSSKENGKLGGRPKKK